MSYPRQQTLSVLLWEEMTTKQRRSTIKDVAELAGVSIGTASNVLSGKKHLHSPDAIRRVEDAVRLLGYRPNRSAQSLVKCCTNVIGVCIRKEVTRLSSDTYFSGLLDGILSYLGEIDYSVKIITASEDDPQTAISRMDDYSVDGVILISPLMNSPFVGWAKQSNMPVVVAGELMPNTGLPGVDVDDGPAVRSAVMWLVSLGHRRICCISGPSNYASANRRLQAYKDALQEVGIQIQPQWIYEGDYWTTSGRDGIRELLKRVPDLTAVVCGNDWQALGALESLYFMGIRVPHDISLIGFDDIEFAKMSQPPLATVRQSIQECGKKAAEMLVSKINGRKDEVDRLLFPATLIQRESVAPPRVTEDAAIQLKPHCKPSGHLC